MHNIDMSFLNSNGTYGAFAANRQGGWHLLGVVHQDPLPALELLQSAGGDFEIRRGAVKLDETVSLDVPDGMPPVAVRYTATDERNTAIYRVHPTTGEAQILGIASDGYPLWTPRETMVGFADAFTGGTEIAASTAGVLDGGRRVFMAYELPTEMNPGGLSDERVQLYMLIHTSFDQSAITSASITPIRAVCANTVQMGIAEAISTMRIKKTRNADLHAKQAAAAIELLPKFQEQYLARANELLAKKITDAQFEAIVTNLWGPGDDPSKRQKAAWDVKMAEIVALWNADTQVNVKGTAYGALQTITERQDWFTGVGSKVADADADKVRFARSVGITDGRNINEPKIDLLEELLAMAA